MGLSLFDDDDNGIQDVSKIEINEEFARRYEHNKKREDLQRLEELKKKGLVSESESDSESESEEEDEELLKPSKKKDLEFFQALIKVKNQDPELRSTEAKLFVQSDSDSHDQHDVNNKKGAKNKDKKPLYLKDVVAKHLIEEGPEFDDEENERGSEKSNLKSYAEEQEELRKEFLKAVEEDEGNEDNDEEFLRVKDAKGNDDNDDENEGDIYKKLDEYFGEDEKLDENAKFLKDYFRNRMWMDHERNDGNPDEQVAYSEDEEEIEKQEDYERDYNFRFEENAGDRVLGHSRKVEGSVRKKDNARKLQRERKEERMAQAEFERREELKRLKNLKKKEIKKKLEKIREAAGIGEDIACLLDEDDLEEEFDPEEYDRRMKKAFDEKYYEAEDANPEFGSDRDEDNAELEKPDFDKEDELLGLPKGWDDVKESDGGFLSTRQRLLENMAANGTDNEILEDEVDPVPQGGKRKRKRKPSEVEKAVQEQLMEEYYKLDYEDTIGDLKTRFKYKSVPAKRYGLNTEEILAMDDKELNQYVSLKKLAPYREKEWKVPCIKRFQQKQMSKALLKGEMINADNEKKMQTDGPKGNKVDSATENEKLQPEELNGETGSLSRRSKRRRRQAEVKVGHKRLTAYGMAPSKPKSKKHHTE